MCSFQVLDVDIIGPFTRSSRGNSYLLVAADWFSKYIFLHTMREETAAALTKFVENSVFLTYGVQQFITYDGIFLYRRLLQDISSP